MADLLGKTILVTRALHQADEFITAIEQLGGQAIAFPTIDIAPPTSWDSCDSAIRNINSYDSFLFTSTNGVEFFFRRLDELQRRFSANGKRVYAVGSSTKHLLEEHNLQVSSIPEKFTAEELANSLSDDEIRGKKFLYPRGNLGRDTLIENFSSRGGVVQAVEVYQTVPPQQNDVAQIYGKLASGQIHAITFTSPSTIKNFASLFTREMMQEIYHHTAFAVIGPVTAEASTKLGFPPHVIAGQSTVNSLVHDLAQYFSMQITESQTPNPKPQTAPNDLFLRAARRQPVERTPLWIMRQAGRYLPEYRAVRAKADFLTLCKTPELAAEVTIQPVEIIGVDAAIIFSDILVVPEAMGMELIVEEGQGGPRFPLPIRSAADIRKLAVPDPNEKLRYVMNALRLTRKALAGRVPLIGFSGSPWTLAAYMVEGHGSRNFRYIKEMAYNEPKLAHELLEKLAKSVSSYLKAQIEAGAQAVQIFDTWGGILTQDAFQEFSLRYIEQIVHEVKPTGVPVIVFCKDCGHSIDKIAATGCDVVGLDWTIDIGNARKLTGHKVALQGNMDPTILYAKPEVIRKEVKNILQKFGKGSGHIFNLGHGILPDIPVEHVKEFVRAVREESVTYH